MAAWLVIMEALEKTWRVVGVCWKTTFLWWSQTKLIWGFKGVEDMVMVVTRRRHDFRGNFFQALEHELMIMIFGQNYACFCQNFVSHIRSHIRLATIVTILCGLITRLDWSGKCEVVDYVPVWLKMYVFCEKLSLKRRISKDNLIENT